MNMNSISIVLPVENHNFESDSRVLIPFIQYQKYGFMNKGKEVVDKPGLARLAGCHVQLLVPAEHVDQG